jgi:hypothetical protein
MKTRGISLVELLVTLFIFVITMGAVIDAFVSGLGSEKHTFEARKSKEETFRFEDGLSKLIAYADLTDSSSVFESPIPSDGQAPPPDSSSGLAQGSSSLVITTWNPPPGVRFLEQSDAPWESLNSRFGPEGGTTEVALSTVPVGDAGAKLGLFIREQKPPQTDPSSGGTERVYSPNVRDIRFEFYDGTTWQTSWDSKNAQKGALPTAVRITYLAFNEKTPHTFLIRLRTAAGGAPSS